MKHLSCDIETYSSVDLKKAGVYKYCEAEDFTVLLFGYSVDGGEVESVDLASGETIAPAIIDALMDETVTKWAFNSQFERVSLSRWLRDLSIFTGDYLNPSSWRCSMVWSAYMGLPLSLEGVGAVLGLEKQKLTEGKDLIRYFCRPCKPTAANGGRTRNLPVHAPDKWAALKAYNHRDVEAEMSIQEKLARFPVPDSIWEEYRLDQQINDRGIMLDMELVRQAIKCDERSRAELTRLMRELTELENPNSVVQMKAWLAEHGLETDTLGKATVRDLLKTAPEPLGQVLELRQSLAKSSVKKYTAMDNVVCADNRARGLLQFYGANRTGRFAGRLIQSQNLPMNILPDLEQARSLVRAGNFAALEMLYGSVPEVLSELIRTAFIPKPGCKFIVADFASIERVVLAWLAGEQWVLDAYSMKKDLYIATASQMFHVPVEQIDKKNPLRQKGKVADLACIAKGQLVLTDTGLVPIESVTILHRVWDGQDWVTHDGVVFRGRRETVDTDGVICTPDHLILTSLGWIESGKCSGLNWAEVRSPYRTLPNYEQPSRKSNVGMPLRLRFGKSLRFLQPFTRKHKVLRLPHVRKADGTWICLEKCSSEYEAFLPSLGGHEEPVLFPKKPLLQCIRWARNYCLRKMARFRELQGRYVGILRTGAGIRPHKWRWELLTEQLPLGYGEAKQSKPAQSKTLCHSLGQIVRSGNSGKARLLESLHTLPDKEGRSQREIMSPSPAGFKQVYDLLNCGKQHRFVVWNGYRLCLVHNCGYGGSVGALKAMGALEMGLSEEDLKPLVSTWRSANPNIVRFWWDVDRAAMTAVRERTTTKTHGIPFSYQSGMLFIILPSGRRLAYVKPKIELNRFGSESVTYEGVGATKKWERIESYGSKFVENLVQAISRDILCHAMRWLDQAGHCIVTHIHDEVVLEVPAGVLVQDVCASMSKTPPWAKGLMLRTDGFEGRFYKKG